jgi:hypothetical protein
MNTVAIVGVDADPAKLLEVAQNLCELDEVKCVATSSGDHMVMTEIWTRDGRELTRLISENRIYGRSEKNLPCVALGEAERLVVRLVRENEFDT